MSEEKKSGGGAGASSIVLVEQTATSRHKQPFRSTDLKDETTDMHKRSKALIVSSAVTEELKDKDTTNVESNERKESDRAMSSEKHKHAAKKLSNTKRRSSSPETIIMAPLELEIKVGSTTPPTQPIPAQLSEASISEVLPEKSASRKREEDDSITDDITELRTPDPTSAWENVELCKEKEEMNKENVHKTFTSTELEVCSSHSCKRKEVVFGNSKEYLKSTKIKDLSSQITVALESKASVGPCFYPTTPFGKPSGITISIPKKSVKSINEMYSGRQSVINISVGKKTQKSRSFNVPYIDEDNQENVLPNITFLGALREKISNVGDKIKSVLNS